MFEIGFQEDPANRVTMAELLTFKMSQSGNEQIRLMEYFGRMKRGQTDIYCITFEILAVLVNKKRFDVLYVVDPLKSRNRA